MKITYLDYSATTPVDRGVFTAMKPYFMEEFGNASEPHFLGVQALQAVEKSRREVAALLNAEAENIIFTGSATESINLSHKGLIEALRQRSDGKKLHIITSCVEHKAVLETCKHLEELGWAQVSYLPVDKYGRISVAEVEKTVRPETVLVSVMYVNNEVGTIQPIAEIGRLLKKINPKIYFHTDATQAVQYLESDVGKLGVDLLSFAGHKICAPKGIGGLYVRKGTPLTRQIDGGRQEKGLRAGTENIPYIAGLGKAAEIARLAKKKEAQRLEKLRERLIKEVLKIPGVRITGDPEKRAPHIASFLIGGLEGESLILLLADKGIIASTGSACNSGNLQPSHVLQAMGIAPEDSHGSIRFSLGRGTSEEDVDYVSAVLPEIINRLREMAPKF